MAGTIARRTGTGPVSAEGVEGELLDLLGHPDEPVTERALVDALAAVVARHVQVPGAQRDLGSVSEDLAQLLALLPSRGPWSDAVGPVYVTRQVRSLLGGVSRQALLDRARRRTMLALRTSDGHTVYPTWQFNGPGVLPGLAHVLACFAPDEHGEVVDGWTLAAWLRQPLQELHGRSVRDCLTAGEVAPAVSVAESAARRWSR